MIPYICPICVGKGFVPAGFYAGASTTYKTETEVCKACAGTGIFLEREDD